MYRLYTKNNCPRCVELKNQYQKQNIPYTEIDIEADVESYNFLVSKGHRSLPVVYQEETLIYPVMDR